MDRECKICGELLPLSAFEETVNSPGYRRQCRACRVARQRERMAVNPEAQARKRQSDAAVRSRRDPLAAAQRRKEWAEANPDRVNASRRRAYLRRAYGVTPEWFAETLAEQDERCAACGEPQRLIIRGKPVTLAIDHDHTTGAIRGLLCDPCNRAVGSLGDSSARAEALAAYLRRFGY